MSQPTEVSRRAAVLGAAASGALLWAGGEGARAQAQKPSELRIGITTFLSGPASVFGVPAGRRPRCSSSRSTARRHRRRAAARLLRGRRPGADHLVGEYRGWCRTSRCTSVFASISSGSCLACTPLSTELRKTTLLWDCGTQRIFEEGKHPYAFRTQGYGTPEVLAPLLYLLKTKPTSAPSR
jgi:branched-chain amino acid transport system substrate-binding protein